MQESELVTDEPSSATFPRAKSLLSLGPHKRLNYCSPHSKDKPHGFSDQIQNEKLLVPSVLLLVLSTASFY